MSYDTTTTGRYYYAAGTSTGTGGSPRYIPTFVSTSQRPPSCSRVRKCPQISESLKKIIRGCKRRPPCRPFVDPHIRRPNGRCERNSHTPLLYPVNQYAEAEARDEPVAPMTRNEVRETFDVDLPAPQHDAMVRM